MTTELDHYVCNACDRTTLIPLIDELCHWCDAERRAEGSTVAPPQQAATAGDAGALYGPPYLHEIAKLMHDTEGHSDPLVRSARRTAAQALDHLRTVLAEVAKLDQVVELSLTAVHRAEDLRVAEPSGEGHARRRAPSRAKRLMDEHGFTASEIREWALTYGHPVSQLGNPKLELVEAYLEHTELHKEFS